MKNSVLLIPHGITPSVLLLGNGINRAYGFLSWSELLNKISDQKDLKLEGVPAPLQAIILTNDNVDTKLKEIAVELVGARAPMDEEDLLRQIAKLPYDAILTANYTYELEKAIYSKFCLTPGKASKYRQVSVRDAKPFVRDNLFTYFNLPGYNTPIWHIHGEAGKVKTMILGHYYYGKMLSNMDSYLSDVIRRYKISQSLGKDFECKSWIDYFLIGNVTIMALGMDFAELDLWWLINAKKRNFPNTKITFYKPDITDDQVLLANTYGIDVIKERLDNGYRSYYEKLVTTLL